MAVSDTTRNVGDYILLRALEVHQTQLGIIAWIHENGLDMVGHAVSYRLGIQRRFKGWMSDYIDRPYRGVYTITDAGRAWAQQWEKDNPRWLAQIELLMDDAQRRKNISEVRAS